MFRQIKAKLVQILNLQSTHLAIGYFKVSTNKNENTASCQDIKYGFEASICKIAVSESKR